MFLAQVSTLFVLCAYVCRTVSGVSGVCVSVCAFPGWCLVLSFLHLFVALLIHSDTNNVILVHVKYSYICNCVQGISVYLYVWKRAFSKNTFAVVSLPVSGHDFCFLFLFLLFFSSHQSGFVDNVMVLLMVARDGKKEGKVICNKGTVYTIVIATCRTSRGDF